jgi:lipoate-protein ligase A
MALDEALFEGVRDGGSPVLRFYTWSPSTLSLGRHQHSEDGLAPGAQEVPRVRRLTGGGAIWHSDELTYSLACTQEDLRTSGVKASFELLCGFLLDTWKSLGWDAHFAKDVGQAPELGQFSPACFAGKEEYDVLVNGKKLGGNAQRRDRKTVFQHGSIPVRLDRKTLESLFSPGYRPLEAETTDLETCGWTDPIETLIPLLVRAFAARLGSEVREGVPSAAETSRAAELVRDRYGNVQWTEIGSGSVRAFGVGVGALGSEPRQQES